MKYHRYDFLKRINEKNEIYNADLIELKKAGYKEEYNGFGLAANFFKGQDYWVGTELTLIQHFQPSFKLLKMNVLKNKNEKGLSRSAHSLSVFSVGYNYNWNKEIHDFSFSLLHFNSPLSLNFTRIGFQKHELYKKGNWFYRPEIGFGIGSISFSLAYNFMFNKSLRNVSEKEMLNIRYAPIIYKYKKENNKNKQFYNFED